MSAGLRSFLSMRFMLHQLMLKDTHGLDFGSGLSSMAETPLETLWALSGSLMGVSARVLVCDAVCVQFWLLDTDS